MFRIRQQWHSPGGKAAEPDDRDDPPSGKAPAPVARGMIIGFSLWPQNTTWPSLRDAGIAVDSAGLDMLFAWDHFYAIAGLATNPNFEVSPLLAGWAAVTAKVQLGALVHGVTHRHPAVLAKMTTALDHVSDGRAIMGLGAAWMEQEHEAYGIRLGSKRMRSDRLEEAAGIVRSMLRNRTTTFEGKYYRVIDAVNEPRPLQPALPILIGGGGERRTLRTAAMFADIWHGYGPPQEIKHKCEVLRAHCGATGRAASEIRILAGGWIVVRDDVSQVQAYLEQVAAHHGIGLPSPRAMGDPDAVAHQLFEYARAGADGFIVNGCEPFDYESIDRLAREVRPRLDQLISAPR